MQVAYRQSLARFSTAKGADSGREINGARDCQESVSASLQAAERAGIVAALRVGVR
jgi:hypothetical protein